MFVFEDAGGVHLWCTGRLRMITNNLALGFCTGVWVLVLKLVSFPLFPYGAYSWNWRPNLSSILWSICNNKCYMAKYSGTSPRSKISCTSLGSPRLEAADSATDLNVQWCPRWGGHFSSAFQAEWGPCVSMSYLGISGGFWVKNPLPFLCINTACEQARSTPGPFISGRHAFGVLMQHLAVLGPADQQGTREAT